VPPAPFRHTCSCWIGLLKASKHVLLLLEEGKEETVAIMGSEQCF
jgi:hypothetical protein